MKKKPESENLMSDSLYALPTEHNRNKGHFTAPFLCGRQGKKTLKRLPTMI